MEGKTMENKEKDQLPTSLDGEDGLGTNDNGSLEDKSKGDDKPEAKAEEKVIDPKPSEKKIEPSKDETHEEYIAELKKRFPNAKDEKELMKEVWKHNRNLEKKMTEQGQENGYLRSLIQKGQPKEEAPKKPEVKEPTEEELDELKYSNPREYERIKEDRVTRRTLMEIERQKQKESLDKEFSDLRKNADFEEALPIMNEINTRGITPTHLYILATLPQLKERIRKEVMDEVGKGELPKTPKAEGTTPSPLPSKGTLTDEEKVVARKVGVSEEAYLKNKLAMNR